MEESFYLETTHGRVFCRQWGRGDSLLIAFHGFGDHSTLFERLEPSVSEHRWMMAIDLPFHGKTEWHKSECSREDIRQIVQLLMDKAQKSSCTLLGFSLGGRIALSLWPDMRGKVESLILLAPDGIRTKGLAWPEALPLSLRQLARRWILSSPRSSRVIRWISRQNWLSEISRRFIQKQLSTPEKLETALNWWVSLASFSVSPAVVRRMTSHDPVPVQIWVGVKDPLILLQDIAAFWQGYPALEIKEIKGKGHRVGFTHQ